MPNTKTKKFDFQIFLAVSMILLVICCATVCVVLSNNENGVAQAEYIGDNNPGFETTTNFYLKDLSSFSVDDFKSFVEYVTFGTDGVMTTTTDLFLENYIGFITINRGANSVDFMLRLDFNQVAASNLIFLDLKLVYGSNSASLFQVLFDYSSNTFLMNEIADNDGVTGSIYTFNIANLKDKSWFSNMFSLTGVTPNVTDINFIFNTSSNLSCIISSSTTFAPIPNYEEALQTEIDRLNAEIGRLNGIIQNQYQDGYDDGVLAGSQFYKDMTYNESLYRNGESSPYEIYPRKILDLTEFLTTAFNTGSRWQWCTSYLTTSIGGGVLYYPAEKNIHLSSIGDVLSFYKENNNQPIYCIYDGGASALHKFDSFDYIIDGYDFSIMLNDGYALGYQQGINDGNKATEEELKSYEQRGFENGKLQGLQIGRQQGYNQGVMDSNDYSFFSLFSAVFDAPITAIVGRWGDSDGDGVYEREGGMLNFYIPGLEINFAPFLLSMFTIAIIVMIIRFILARKS